MIRFTKAKTTPPRPKRPGGGKKATLDKLRAFLSQAEPDVVEILMSGFSTQQNTVTYKELREAHLAGGISQKQFEKWQADYTKLITVTLAPRWKAAAAAAAQEVKAKYPYLLYDPDTSAGMSFLGQHGAELVTNIVQEQRDALNAVIQHVSGYTNITPDEAARIIRPCVGLTKPQALANVRYREAVKQAYIKAHPRGKLETAEKRAADAAARYAARQHRYRAQNIARTELAFAYNAGAYGATKDAQAQGYVGDCAKVWLTAYDERVCPICSAMDDEKRNMDEAFSNGKLLPPAHPSCRCAVAYEEIDNTNLTPGQGGGAQNAESFGQHTGDQIQGLTVSGADGIMEIEGTPKAGDMMSRGITDDRSLAMGFRTPKSHVLTDKEIESIKEDAEAIEVPVSLLRFNEGTQTGFRDRTALIYIRGDILPDRDSTIARDRMSKRAVLAHEYYGHYKHHPSEYEVGDWRDEFRASYAAATDAPNLSDEDRALLMIDAYDRAKEAGVILEYDEKARKIIYGY